jgi:hypothetical protein
MAGASTRKSSPWQGLFFSLMAVVALLSSTAPKLEQVSVEGQALRVAHQRTLFAAFPETLTKKRPSARYILATLLEDQRPFSKAVSMLP